MAFNLDDYEPVADRIERFWQDHQIAGRILTDLVHRDEKSFIVKASIYLHRDAADLVVATGYAEEVIGSTNVNRTSALENCETSAIGRALANLGYAVKNRASREEMEKAQPTPRPRSGGRRGPTPPLSPVQGPATHLPESLQRPENGAQSHLTPEEALQITKIKNGLLARLNGDKEEASRLWRGTVQNFGLDPDQPLPADMIPAIEHSIKSLGIKGEE